MNQTTKLSNRELRALRAKELRSDAINRFMDQCADEAITAKGEILLYKGFLAFLSLVALTAIMGWQ